MKRWILRIGGALLGLVAVAALTIYAVSEVVIRARHDFREHPIERATDVAQLARGEHLVRVGCRGCHGEQLEGRVFLELPGIARIVAPNVIDRLSALSDAEFAGFLRHGVRKDGSVSFVMPLPGQYHLSDADLGAIIGYLRTVPLAVTPALPATSFGPLARFGIATGKFQNVLAAFDTSVARVGDDPAWSTSRQGEYLARVICANCHGPTLMGDPSKPSPALVAALAYTPEQFRTLLREGRPRDPATTLGLMGEVASLELKHLTDDEINAIHGYLRTLGPRGVQVATRR